MAGNSIFDKATYRRTKSHNMRGRVDLLAKDVAAELNTYKNFGIFHTFNDVHAISWDAKTREDATEPREGKPDLPGTPGVRSIFNKYSSVLTGWDRGDVDLTDAQSAIESSVISSSSWRVANNVPLLDTPENRAKIRKHSGCTVRELVKASQSGYFGAATYSYADFMYCKYLNKVPNNYLITLRRFPVPILDNISPQSTGARRKKINDGVNLPIGTMVTWMGVSGNDMKQILKYSYKMPYKEQNAQWEDVQSEGGDQGLLNGLEAMFNPTSRKMYAGGTAVPALDNNINTLFGKVPGIGSNQASGPYTYKDFQYDKTKLYGDIDRVKKAYGRGADGLDFDQKITLVFEYELKAYNGINPRQAMLDLLASILSVTYTTGGFWKGGYRGGGIRQSSVFSNLQIFKTNGSFTDFMDALTQDLSNGGAALKDSLEIDTNSVGGFIKSMGRVLNGIGGMLMGGMLNKLGRPKRYFAPSLISDAPVGLWHITIGNPHHPIMQMGNMVLTNTEIEHSGPLGLDDFPTNLKVTCSFDRGKPRDQYGIENMYMSGNDRIYHSMSGKLADMYKVAQAYKANKHCDVGKAITADKVDSLTTTSSAYNTKGQNPNSTEAAAGKSGMATAKNIATNLADAGVSGDTWRYYFGLTDGTIAITSAEESDKGAFKKKPKETTEESNQTTDTTNADKQNNSKAAADT
jgi:hypothetical protein